MAAESGGHLCSQPAEMHMDAESLSDGSVPCDLADSFVFPIRKPGLSTLKRSADPSPSSSAHQGPKRPTVKNLNLSPNQQPASSPLPSASSPSAPCLILREDHKSLPFNFFNTALPKWTALACLIPSSLERNQKGTVIVGQINPDKAIALHSAPHKFIMNEITYLLKVPQTHTPYIGEIIFDLTDIDDRSILSLSETQIMAQLTVSSSCATNAILSVQKVYPRKTLSDSDSLYSSVHSMRISIECSSAIPDRVFFHSVSLRVSPYILPPIRCFRCQRYGHGAISCRRSARCARCSSTNHITTACNPSNELNCFACGPGSSHTCSSTRCKFYKAALTIAAHVQCGNLNRDQASAHYASLYSSPEKVPPAQPLIMPSPVFSPQLPPTKGYPKPVTNTAASSSSSSIPSLHPSPVSCNFTAAQRKAPKGLQSQKTPPHMTPEYADVLSGNLWYNSQGPCISPAVAQGSSCSGSSPTVPSPHSPSTSSPASSASGSPILTLLKSLFQHLLGWILSSLSTDSPVAVIFSTLLQSLSASLLSSS